MSMSGVSSSSASERSTSRVWEGLSLTVSDNSRVSFSGCSWTAVVVTISPVGPSRSISFGTKPSLVDSTVS